MRTQILPIHIELKSKGETVKRKRYLIPLEGRLELQPIFEGLLPGMAFLNPASPLILPVKKPCGSYRSVQDLRAINQIVQSGHPGVPNSYALLSKTPHDHKWFRVVD
jgi:hypothetical protein